MYLYTPKWCFSNIYILKLKYLQFIWQLTIWSTVIQLVSIDFLSVSVVFASFCFAAIHLNCNWNDDILSVSIEITTKWVISTRTGTLRGEN